MSPPGAVNAAAGQPGIAAAASATSAGPSARSAMDAWSSCDRFAKFWIGHSTTMAYILWNVNSKIGRSEALTGWTFQAEAHIANYT